MSELSTLTPDEWDALADEVRMHNTAKLREVLAVLAPYVDGSVGMVSPAHVRLYLQALKDLGQMYRVGEGPRAVAAADPAAEVHRLQAAQARVLDQLEVLEAKARQRRLGS